MSDSTNKAVRGDGMDGWSGGGMTARGVWREHKALFSHKMRPVHEVEVTAAALGPNPVRFRLDECLALTTGKSLGRDRRRLDIIETYGASPTSFLARANAASEDAPAYQQLKDLPPHFIVLLVSDENVPRAAVLDDATIASFVGWLQSLPENP